MQKLYHLPFMQFYSTGEIRFNWNVIDKIVLLKRGSSSNFLLENFIDKAL